MDDLLLAIIGSILEICAEALFQFVMELLASLLVRTGRKLIATPQHADRTFTVFLFAIFGAAAGLVSVAIFPHPLVHRSRFHPISLLFSPVVTGLAMFLAGRLELRFNRRPTQIETFWIGFIFALAMAIVRLILVK